MKPSKKEIIEHFKDAEKCEDWKKDKFIFELDKIKETDNGWVQNSFDKNWGVLWLNNKGYAKILTYKKPKFVPIAMKCNQEQFDSIKPKLEKAGIKIDEIWSFEICSYLTNAYRGCDFVSNIQGSYLHDFNRTIHKTWNEEVFLNACCIETEKSYTITKEQIIKYDMREEFPEVFKKELSKFFTGWLKTKSPYDEKWIGYADRGVIKYGITSNEEWFSGNDGTISSDEYEATPEEVFEALKSEVFKRYKIGNYIKSLDYDVEEILEIESMILTYERCDNSIHLRTKSKNAPFRDVFKDGIWASIIKPKQMTQSDIEKELGYLIEIV